MQQTDVRSLALAQFRNDWPLVASRLDGMRDKAGRADGACDGERALPGLITPPSNTGVNESQPVARGSN